MKDTGGAHRNDPDDRPRTQSRSRQRGASPAAIAGALHRTPHPGPQHWGGPRPRKADPDPFFSNGTVPPPGEHPQRH